MAPNLQRDLRLVGIAAFSAMAAMRCADPMLRTLGQEFERSIGDVSAVVSAFAISYGVCQLAHGALGDRIGKLRVIAFAAAACAMASGFAALAWSLDALVLARALMGATAAGIVPLAMAWIGDNVGYAQRQETLARLLGATVSGMIAGQCLGAWLTEAFGWRAVFAVLATTFLAAAWPLWCAVRQRQVTLSRASSASVRETISLLAQSHVRWVLAVAATEGALMFGVLAFAPSFIAQRHGLGTAAAGAAIAMFGVGGLLYSLLAKRLLGRLGERGLAAAGGALVGASLLALAWSGHWVAVLPACLLAGAGFYMLHATLQTQATQMAPEHRGTAVAWFACLLFLGQSIGVVAVSMAVDQGLAAQAISACGIGLMVLGTIVARGVGTPVSAAA